MEQIRLCIIFILATFSFSLMAVALERLAVAASSTMVFPNQHWQETEPEAQGVDSAKLKAAVAYLKENSGSDGIRELVIIRNGCMIWKGTDIDKMHGVWSLTKSFTSTVLGLLIDDGKAALDTLAKDYVPSMAQVYPDITLRHFTTMTSGYAFHNYDIRILRRRRQIQRRLQTRTEPHSLQTGSEAAVQTARLKIRLLGFGHEPVCQCSYSHRR